MEQLAVFTAFTAALLLAANAVPTNITDHSSQLTDDSPTELHSINQPRSQAKGVFDDSFTYNEKHFIYPIYENTKEIEDMMFEVDDSSMEQENNEQYRNKRNAVSNLWPGGIIPYVITPSFDAQEKRIILQAMRHWEENTCIRFRPRVSEPYYIQIRTSSPGDCRSYLGRTRIRPQPLFLGPNCVRISTVVHELGHAIGFYHEHSRVDRDEYISILENNIFSGITRAFGKDSGNTLGLGYDYASIMHYSSRAFSKDGRSETIRANQPNIPIGEAEELSPLDILKANKLYNCRCPLSPPNTVVPPALPPVRPSGVTCGTVEVLRGGETRTVQSPRYPSHVRNLECAWVFECASGFLPQIEFPSLNLESSSGCTKDYAQLYFGLSLDIQDVIRYGGLTDGRICGNRYSRTRFFASTNIITTFYRTDNSGGSTGLQVKITCIDENECQNARCDNCRNTPGSFECSCNKGYYFSKAATTCYDVNECAYENGGCQHICVNMGGSYRCLCPSGQYVQSDGKRCGTRRPSFSTLPIAPKLPSSCPVTSPPTSPPTTTTPPPTTTTPPPTTTTPPPTTTTPPPTTTTPPPTTTTPPPPRCGGVLTTASGSFQTPSWPNTYPLTNFHCQWICRLPSTGCQILLRFDDSAFGIAGKTSENCPKDHLRIYDNRGRLVKRICGNAVPSPILTTDNSRILFVAGPDHGPLHKGFRIEYREICPTTPPTVATTTPRPTTRPTTRPTSRPTTRPTTLPPTITPPSLCGGRLRGASGDLQTPAWPQTYPLNFDCEWNIQVPSPGCNVRLTFDGLAFGIAGKTTENCPRDYLKIHDNNGLIHTICDLGRPSLITTTGNTRLYFYAGPYHGPKRKGFKIYYTIVCPTTPPPTTRPTTVATTTPDPTTPPPTTRPTTVATTVPATRPTTTTPPTTLAPTTLPPPTPNCPVLPVNPQGNFVCGGFMRPGDSFGPANLPSGPIPNKISCQWVVFNTVTSQFKVSFKYFDIPSSEECSSNSVAVYDGYGTRAPLIEKICGEKCDEYIVEGTGYIMTVVLKVSSPGSFRGFFATFTEQ